MKERMRARKRCLVFLLTAAALALGGIGAERAGADVLERPRPRIVNGVLATGYPSVGALLNGPDADTAIAWCSGTLIGCETFLTAAHCVENGAPEEFHVFVPSAGIFAVASIAIHPAYDFPAADVAVLKLAAAVNGVAPSAINTTNASAPGSPGTIVGYGRSGGLAFDYGLKRGGAVTTAACTTIPFPGSDVTSVCFNFNAPIGPPGTNSNTCNADSGGPLFVDLGAGDVVAGTTSGGSSTSCQTPDHSYDANVFTYRSFIQGEGGADLANTSCGSLPQVGSAGASVLNVTGTVGAGAPDALHTFQVTGGTTLLRVAMNAIDDGPSDFDLYVKAGSPPTLEDFDCRRFGPNQYGVCELASPTVGPWHVLIHRFSGAGPYQLTVTTFGVDCALPGNAGAPCDDANVCTGNDVCQSGTCVGEAAGNGMPCDDGNVCTTGDACAAGACTGAAVANGTPCNDGLACTQPDTCQSAVCSGHGPASGCKSARSTYLALDDRTPDERDKLFWKWSRGAATTKAEFGNPLAATGYALCVWDETSGVPQLRLEQPIAPGPRWSEFTHGYRYRDPQLASGGVTGVTVRAGSAGKTSVVVRGKSALLGVPALPLAQESTVTVQLLNGTACFEADYSTSSKNDAGRFRARGD